MFASGALLKRIRRKLDFIRSKERVQTVWCGVVICVVCAYFMLAITMHFLLADLLQSAVLFQFTNPVLMHTYSHLTLA